MMVIKWSISLLSYLAHASCMPRVVYVLFALISFLMIAWRPVISRSTILIFIKFSSTGRYLVIDYWSSLFYNRSRDMAMATNFGGQNRWNRHIHLHSSLWHSKTDWNIAILVSKDSLSMIWLQHIKIWWIFGTVTPELTRVKGAHPSSISSLAMFAWCTTARHCGVQYWVVCDDQCSVLFYLFNSLGQYHCYAALATRRTLVTHF